MTSGMPSYEADFFCKKIYIKSKLYKSQFAHYFSNEYALSNNMLLNIGISVVNTQKD